MTRPIIPGCTVQLLHSKAHPELVGEYFIAVAREKVPTSGIPGWAIAGHGFRATVNAHWLRRVDWDERHRAGQHAAGGYHNG